MVVLLGVVASRAARMFIMEQPSENARVEITLLRRAIPVELRFELVLGSFIYWGRLSALQVW